MDKIHKIIEHGYMVIGTIFVGILLLLWISNGMVRTIEVMPKNARLFIDKDNNYISPPCIKKFGIYKYGFENDEDLISSATTNGQLSKNNHPNEFCTDKYTAPIKLFNRRLPFGLVTLIQAIGIDLNHHGGFKGDEKGWLTDKIPGLSDPRWNKDGTWNW